MADAKPERRKRSGKDGPDGYELGTSFVMVSGPFMMDPTLTDAERVFLIVLESWAWNDDHCWAGNDEIARRCGWFLASGKPNNDKAQRVAQGLDKKGRIHRVIKVVNGQYERDRIDILGTRTDAKLPPTAILPQGTADSPYGTADSPHPTAILPYVHGNNAAPPGQNCPTGTALSPQGTAKVPLELDPVTDPVTDPGNQTQGIDPPHTPTKQARGGGVEKIQYDQARDDEELRRMLAGLAEVGVRHVEQKRRVKALAHWLLARLDDNPTLSGIAVKLWRIVSGKTSVDDAFGHWSAQMIPF